MNRKNPKDMSDEELGEALDEWWSKTNDAGKDHAGLMLLIADLTCLFKKGEVTSHLMSGVLNHKLRAFHAEKLLQMLIKIGEIHKMEPKVPLGAILDLTYEEAQKQYELHQAKFMELVEQVPGWSKADTDPKHEPEVEAVLKRKENRDE